MDHSRAESDHETLCCTRVLHNVAQPAIRILHVPPGDEQSLLHRRRAVLRSAGYWAQTATLSEVELLLRTRYKFDLIIVSSGLNKLKVGLIFFAAGQTPAYVLVGANASRGTPGSSGTAASVCRSAEVGEVRQCQKGTSKTSKMMRAHVSSVPPAFFGLGSHRVFWLLLPFINLGIGT